MTLSPPGGTPIVQVTDAQGQFRFLGLGPGQHDLVASLEGFSTVDYPNIGITGGRNTTVEVTLSPAVEEVITVTSESPLLDERRITSRTGVSETELEKIPAARDPWEIVRSTPGILVDRDAGGAPATGDGGPPRSFFYIIDGVVVTDAGVPPVLDYDAIKEFGAAADPTDPPVFPGRAVLNIITKSGGNEFDGSVRTSLTDDSFEPPGGSVGDLNLRPDEDGDYCFDGGVTLGGYLFKDRLWFFPRGEAPAVRADIVPGTGVRWGFFRDPPADREGGAIGRIPGCPGSPFDLHLIDIPDYGTEAEQSRPLGAILLGEPTAVLPAISLTDPLGPARDHEAVELTLNKRFTNNWQLYGSAVWADRAGDSPAGLEFGQGATPAGDPCLGVGATGPDGQPLPGFLRDGAGVIQFDGPFVPPLIDFTRNPLCDPAVKISFHSSLPVATHVVLGEHVAGFDMDLAAYNVEGTWAPVRDIRFRSSFYKAVRAPSIQELFGGTPVPTDGGLFVMAVDLPPSAAGATGDGFPWFDLDGDGQRDLTFLSGADFQNPCDGVYYGAFTVQQGEGGGYLNPDPDAPPIDCDNLPLQDRPSLMNDYMKLGLLPSRGALTWFGETGSIDHEIKLGGGYRSGGDAPFVNDRWRLNDQWSFNLGNRYDETPGTEGPAGGFGGQLGGPIVKDRLWIWGTYGQPGTEEEPGGAPPLADAFGDGIRVGYGGTLESYMDLGGFNPGFLGGGLFLDGQNYGTRLRIQANGAQRGPGGSIPDLAEASPLLLFESLGGSTGEVVRAHLLHDGAGPVSVEGFAVLEPVETTSGLRERFDEALQGAAAKTTATVEAYCLDKAKLPLSQGELFRLAPRAVQEAYAHVGGILDAAERLRDAGGLTPDTNPASYFHSIRQWAVWTHAEEYDQMGFLEAFAEHTRKNVEEGGQRWTDEIEQVVRRSAEGRWRDVESVLEAAAAASR